MAPRTILYTGKGGVGKTSVATATARRCAAQGLRTIVLSTDPAHSLAESLETAVGGQPTDVGDGLFAQQIQAQDELERHWSGVQRWLGGVLMERGVDRIAAEELTVPPGGDELFSLLALKAHHESGDWDVIVVDCAPTGETLRLLSFPDAARWWLDKVLGRERALLAAARPLARTFLDLQLPDDRAFGEIQSLVGNLVAMHDLLRDAEHASIRLVMTPDRMVVAEAMRTFTYLNLYGYVTDAVVVNRVFPDEVDGTYFGAWRAVQAEQLELVESGFAPVPVLRAPYFEREVLGAADARPPRRGAVRGPRRRLRAARPRHAGAVAARRRRGAAAGPALRLQGRRVAEEDRAGARRARRRPQAHDPAPGRDGGPPAELGDADGRRAGRRLHRAGAGPCLTIRWTPCARRSGSSARRPSAPSRSPATSRRAATRSRRRRPRPPRRRSRTCRRSTGLVELARGSLPPDLQRQLQQALRELLIALRAVLDYSIDRLEPGPEPPSATVEDIPIS